MKISYHSARKPSKISNSREARSNSEILHGFYARDLTEIFNARYKEINLLFMDDKKAAEILIGLLKKYSLAGVEKEAVENAIGILSWTSLSQSRLKARKEKMNKN